MKRKLKGGLTVFFSLILVSVMTLIFTMSECVRAYELHALSKEYLDMAVESAFSEYNPYLWKNYRILAIDLGYGSDAMGTSILEQRTLDYCRYNANIEYGGNYARLIPDSCQVEKYACLTDSNGRGVIMLGSKAAMDGMAAQIIDGIQGFTDDLNSVEKISVEQEIESGTKSLADAKEANAAAKRNALEDDDPDTNPEDYPNPGEVDDDPLDAFRIMKEAISNGVLSTVTNADSLSEDMLELSEMPSHRSLNSGNYMLSDETGVVDKALFIDYVLTNYNYFGNAKNPGPMKYEVEYLISGKESDAQSLAAVVEELLLIRECANYATIYKSTAMSGEAESIAWILAGFTGNPAIVKAVKYAIIGAWAYIESTLDVRLLLSGGEVPIIKSESDWTSDVWHLSNFLDVNKMAKESKSGGISYKEYLIGFLATKTSNTLGLRCCDVMEHALNSMDDYKNVRVDNMIFTADIKMSYQANEMFLSLFPSINSIGGYEIAKSKSMSY